MVSNESKRGKIEKLSNRHGRVFRIRIRLLGISPPIWRVIEIPLAFNLHQLHLSIQAAMGWENYHLYSFRIGSTNYSVPDPDSFMEEIDSRKTGIRDLIFFGRRARMIYEYDFGDGWEHEVTIQKVLPAEPGVQYPRCVSGRRSCPPEDCGGPYGYSRILEIIRNPEDDEYDETMEWLGKGFDPEEFDIREANIRLSGYEEMESDT